MGASCSAAAGGVFMGKARLWGQRTGSGCLEGRGSCCPLQADLCTNNLGEVETGSVEGCLLCADTRDCSGAEKLTFCPHGAFG